MICLGRKKDLIECRKKMGCTILRRQSNRSSKSETPAEKRSFDELCIQPVLNCLGSESLEILKEAGESTGSICKKGKMQSRSKRSVDQAVRFIEDQVLIEEVEDPLNSELLDVRKNSPKDERKIDMIAKMQRNFSLEFNEVWPVVNSSASSTSDEVFAINDRTSFIGAASKLCLFRFCCYRKSRRKKCASPKSTKLSYEEYSRLSQCSSDVTCSVTTGSASTDSSFLSTSTRSRTLHSESLSGNLSEDSGFDELPCFLNILMHDHTCANPELCNRKKYAYLNAHLRNLMECMPKSFCDCVAEQNAPFGLQRGGFPSRRWNRRNAVCETSVEMRARFTEALRALMTLRAMIKYDFL